MSFADDLRTYVTARFFLERYDFVRLIFRAQHKQTSKEQFFKIVLIARTTESFVYGPILRMHWNRAIKPYRKKSRLYLTGGMHCELC